jgi:hypothetical protein
MLAATAKIQPDLPSRGNDDDQAKPSDRRRDWLSFLTWSFFLAELAGREGILAPGAHAAESDSARPVGRPGEDGAAADNLPVNAIDTDAEEPINVVSPQGPMIVNPPPAELSGEAGDAEIPDPEEGTAQRLSEGSGGGGGGESAPATDAGGQQISLALGQPLEAGDIDLKLTSGVIDGLDNLVPGVELDVPLIANLLSSTTNGVAAIADGALSTLSTVLSIGGLGDSHEGGDDATVSGGHLNFEDAQSASEPEAVPSQGGYTEYGIALNLSFSDSESTAEASDGDAAPSSPDDAPPVDVPSDALHADEAVLRIGGDTLA